MVDDHGQGGLESSPSRAAAHTDILWIIFPEKSKQKTKDDVYLLMNKYSSELRVTISNIATVNGRTIALLNPSDVGCSSLTNAKMIAELFQAIIAVIKQLTKPLVLFCSRTEADIEIYAEMAKAIKDLISDDQRVVLLNVEDPIKVSKRFSNLDYVIGKGNFSYHLNNILLSGIKGPRPAVKDLINLNET